MSSSQTVVVTGATGFIGRAVMKRLHETGWEVIVASRNPEMARRMFPWAASVGYDGEAFDKAVAAHGRVVSLAGRNGLDHRWTAPYKAKMWESRVGTTQRIAKALDSARASDRVLVGASAINIHAGSDRGAIVEDSPLGVNWVAGMITAWEAAARTAERAGARVVALRIGVAIGAGGGPLTFLEGSFRKGMGGHIGNGRQFVPWIHIDDMAEMFVTALKEPNWRGAFIAAAPKPATAREFAGEVGRRLGRASWFHIPAQAARLIIGEAATLVVTSYRACPEKAIRLGFRFRYPNLPEALDAIYGADRRKANPGQAIGQPAEVWLNRSEGGTPLN
jgi:uncharacterized protein (TIGR01777 family)